MLLVDSDPQGSLTISLGNPQPDQLPVTLATIMGKVLNEETIVPDEGLLHHEEGVDLMPANIEANFRDYLNGFSENVQDIIEKFKFDIHITKWQTKTFCISSSKNLPRPAPISTPLKSPT